MQSLQLDVAYEITLEDELSTIPTDIEVHVRVVNPSGPGGGWPIVEFTGEQTHIERLVREWYSSDDTEHANYLLGV